MEHVTRDSSDDDSSNIIDNDFRLYSNKENLNDGGENPVFTSTPQQESPTASNSSITLTPLTHHDHSSGYSSFNSPDVVSMLQTQQKLLETLLTQQKALEQKQDSLSTKLDSTGSRLLAVECRIEESSSRNRGKKGELPVICQ